MKDFFDRTFSSLGVRNYRLFFFGQGISQCGTWAQTIAISWLVLKLTHSGTQLGFVIAAQFLPLLLFGVYGGVIADRFKKRHILYFTQSVAGILALTLGILVLTHSIQLWMIYALALGLGFTQVIDNPSRQTFVIEMVGSDRLKNAVSLNSTMVNGARIIGPSIAGVLIATVGIGPCFIVNALSYIFVIAALIAMRERELLPAPLSTRKKGQIKAGLRYVWSVPRLRATLLMMFIIGTFAYEFPVILPLFASITLHGNASTYSALTVAMGIGAVSGGLYTAGRGASGQRQVVIGALLFGASLVLLSIMPNLVTAFLVLVAVGALSILFISMGNTTLQLTAQPEMRGRVMSLWAIAFLGTTPIGGPLIGAIADHSNPRVGLLVGGLATLFAAVIGTIAGRTKHIDSAREIALANSIAER